MPDIFVAPEALKREGYKKHKKHKRRLPLGSKKLKSPKEYSSVMAETRPTRNPLAAFAVRPKKIRFETQDPEEYVLLLLRRHFITNVPWVLALVVMAIAPVLVPILAPRVDLIPGNFRLVGVVMWYLLVVGFLVENFLSWYFNVYIVTDERIVDIDFYSLIYKEISDTKIERIQDVTVTQGGVIRALFNFGTVYIQTAGEKREFDFEDVPQPQQVSKFLNEMILEEERERIEGRVR